MDNRKPGTEYLYRCTGEEDEEGRQHDHRIFGSYDKAAMDSRIEDDWARCDCGSPIRRVYSFIHGKGMPEHYNLAAGKVVSSEKQLTEHYHKLSEEVSERTNLPHEFVPVSQSDTSALNITGQGLSDSIERREKLDLPISDNHRKMA